MTLDEAVARLPQGVIIHIGAKSLYFFIGTHDEYRTEIDEISAGFEKYYKKRSELLDKYIDMLKRRSITRLDGQSEKEYKAAVEAYYERIAQIEKLADTNRRKLNGFIPFRLRNVIESYKMIQRSCYAVIVDGLDSGRFSTSEDYKAAARHYPIVPKGSATAIFALKNKAVRRA